MSRSSNRPASRAGRQHLQQLSLKRLQLQRKAVSIAQQSDDLKQQVAEHLQRQQHALTTAELIDRIITRFPNCPAFASQMVDRLVHGDEALADALREEGF